LFMISLLNLDWFEFAGGGEGILIIN
jgi:hypothetical protein